MAKGVGIIGTVIGKLGNAVGYRIKDSNNKMSQGFRVYQPNVSNPRTYGQALQRARMKPINTFYRALKSIIDRGFEGKSYGNQCRLEFLRLAMANFNGPYVPKGFNGLLPGPFTISNGSLQSIKTRLKFNGPNGVATSLLLTNDAVLNTVGGLSTAILSMNKALKENDQVTFVEVKRVDGSVYLNIESIVLDTASQDEVRNFISIEEDNNRYLAISSSDVIAAACILSREGESGQHLRSKAIMTVADSIVNTYFTDDAQAAAVASYMNADGTTDWPEQFIPATDVAQLVTIDVTTDMTATEVPAGTQILGFVSKTGEHGIFYAVSGANRVLLAPNGTNLKVQGADVALKADYAGLATEWSSLYGTL